MKTLFKYLFPLVLLLSVIVTITEGGERVRTCTLSSPESKQYEFISQSLCLDDIFGRDVSQSNIVPSNPVRLLSPNHVSEEVVYHSLSLPQVYRNVIAFDIDNLATLGRNQKLYYIFTLHKIRI